MRRFRFLGDPSEWHQDPNMYGDVEKAFFSKHYPEEWQEIFEKPLYKDTDLGYYTQYFISLSPEKTSASDIDFAIIKAKYIIKQLAKKCNDPTNNIHNKQ